MNRIYYSQIDSRWANHPYPSQALPGATIGSGGCGPTCAAMVISMLKNITTPDVIGDMFLKDGIRVNGGTSNAAFDTYLTSKFGLKNAKKWKLDDAVNCLQNGGLVVARCIASRGQLFTTGGHFIVLVGYNNGTIEVYDPYLYSTKFDTSYRREKASISGTSVFVSYSNMKEYGGYCELWCYEPTGVDTNSDEQNAGINKPSYDRGTVGSNRKLKQNCLLYSNPDLTGTTYNYLKNTTVNILANVGPNVDKIYVPKTNRVAYININNYTDTSTSNTNYTVKTVIARSGLNVRSGPGTNYSRITTYAYGTKVKVYSTSNGWSKGTKGYMYAKYLK